MRIRDWSSDVCSSDLRSVGSSNDSIPETSSPAKAERSMSSLTDSTGFSFGLGVAGRLPSLIPWGAVAFLAPSFPARPPSLGFGFSESPSGNACCARSKEHTSELQSLMPFPYAVFCLKKKNNLTTQYTYLF